MKTFIVDTSVILDNVYSILELSASGENRVIIPETVLDEIDNKKSGFTDVNFQAREFNRLMESATRIKQEDITKEGDAITSIHFKFDEEIIELVSKDSYKIRSNSENANIVNDRKILEVARCFKEAILVSNDIAMRIRARSMRLDAEPMRGSRVSDVEEFTFIEEIHIQSSQKENIVSSSPEDYDLTLTFFSNVEFICDDTGEHILAVYKANGFNIINDKDLRHLPIKPRNKEQIFFLNMLLDPDLPIVVCAGVTGSGKNLLSLQGALQLNRSNEQDLNTIGYCRNTVTAGDYEAQLGFLKGDETSKMGVFTYPLIDAIGQYQELAQKEALGKERSITLYTNEEFMKEHDISVLNINQMRGVNLSGVLIFDEWQNSSASVNKLMLTRVTEGSKVVIIGDLNQIDHPHLSKYNNALSIMLKQAKKSDLVGGITMSRVLRGKIAAFAQEEL
jgi:PhoH-like ATPase